MTLSDAGLAAGTKRMSDMEDPFRLGDVPAAGCRSEMRSRYEINTHCLPCGLCSATIPVDPLHSRTHVRLLSNLHEAPCIAPGQDEALSRGDLEPAPSQSSAAVSSFWRQQRGAPLTRLFNSAPSWSDTRLIILCPDGRPRGNPKDKHHEKSLSSKDGGESQLLKCRSWSKSWRCISSVASTPCS